MCFLCLCLCLYLCFFRVFSSFTFYVRVCRPNKSLREYGAVLQDLPYFRRLLQKFTPFLFKIKKSILHAPPSSRLWYGGGVLDGAVPHARRLHSQHRHTRRRWPFTVGSHHGMLTPTATAAAVHQGIPGVTGGRRDRSC